jgi:phage terminase large subunit-like protein
VKRQDKQALEKYLKRLEFARSAGTVNPFETEDDKKTRIERAKKDVKFMVEYYFPHFATSKCAGFQIQYAKDIKRDKHFTGFCEWGRGLAKSVWNTMLIPFWLWINDEPMYYLVIGSSYNRATQLLDDIKAEFEANPRIIADFGEQHNPGEWEDGKFVTKGGFVGQALGRGQSVRGLRYKDMRPTLINPDDIQTEDLLNNPQRTRRLVDWILRDLMACMDGEYGRFSYSNTRHADPKRMIQGQLQEMHPDWKISHVKAYDPVTYEPAWSEKYDNEYYKNVEYKVGKLAALAEYCHIAHTEGSIFKLEHIQYGKMPSLNHFKIIFGTWDIAYSGKSTGDFNAIGIHGLHHKSFWVIDGFCKQCKMRDAVAYMCDFQKRLPKTVMVHWRFEAQFWNDEVERIIKETEQAFGVKLNIVKFTVPKVKKYDRILSLHPYYQNGRIWYNEKLKSHNDTQVGISQLLGIEPGYKGHDDYPDQQQQGISLLEPYNQPSTANNYRFGKMKPKNQRI